MRPTDLRFRHPNQKTPDPYDSFVTSNGKNLFDKKTKTKSTFSTAKRFASIGNDKTSFWRGPGSYDLSYHSVGVRKTKGTPIFKLFHVEKDMSNNSYFYSGNCLVFDPSISLINKRKTRDYFTSNQMINKSRPTTASSRKNIPSKRLNLSPHEEPDNRPSSAFGYNT